MSRQNIFELLSNNFDASREIRTIWDLFINTTFSLPDYYSSDGRSNTNIIRCVGTNTFFNWKSRKRFVSPSEMMNYLDINESKIETLGDFCNDYLIILEFILNMIKRFDIAIENNNVNTNQKYQMLKENINSLIEHFGHETHYNEDDEQVIIIEKNLPATAVAEISEPEIAKKIIQYNHYTLQGNISIKKEIIVTLANELEPKKKHLETINSSLTTDLFFMLNNMNLRHNNIDTNDKNYRQFVAKMKINDLENWYDEIYQMILLSKLLLDNNGRQEKILELKKNL